MAGVSALCIVLMLLAVAGRSSARIARAGAGGSGTVRAAGALEPPAVRGGGCRKLASSGLARPVSRDPGAPDPPAVLPSGPPELPAVAPETFQGRVIDAGTDRPLADAIVTLGHSTVRTGGTGNFSIEGRGERIGVRAYGHVRLWVSRAALARAGGEVALPAFIPKALYLTSNGIACPQLRAEALELARTTQVNALVIDLKSERGVVAFPSRAPLALAIGAEQPSLIPSLKSLVDFLHARGLYAIARIVVFRDSLLAEARPDLAVRTDRGALYRDGEGMAWTDPFSRKVWNYNIAIAVEAARAGFDEIQFDYVRFPNAPGLVFSQPSTQRSRIAAISGFLALARGALAPYNVFTAADIFGYVCWNAGDTGIGQTLQGILPEVDYVSPMLYPSTFQYGIPGYRDPVAHPYHVVLLSLQRALGRTGVSPDRFRPWLQAFKDYAFDRRAFGAAQIQAQINAATAAGTDGWMLWNPRNIYTSAGLQPRPPAEQQVGTPHLKGAVPVE